MGTTTIASGDAYIDNTVAIILTGDVTGTESGNSIATTIKSSVALAGSPTTTTQALTDNSTKIATTSFAQGVAAAAAAAVNSAFAADVASTANIAGTYASVGSGIGDTYTVTATGLLTVDGQSLTAGIVFFAKDFTGGAHVGSYNGLYTVTTAGSGGISTVLTRAADYNQPANINNTGAIQVKTGTVNAGTSWLLTTKVAVVGTDALTYTEFSPAYSTILTTANAVTPNQGGTGVANNNASTLTISGNFATTLTVSGITSVTLPTSGTLVNSAVATLSSLTSIGTIGTGVWQGTAVGATYGGTGVNNGASTITLGGSLTTSGAFATTLTMTAGTSVTLPTSGTLLSTAAVITPAQGGTGIVNNNASTLAISGNFATTLTVSGITGVTLPTSGTLLSTAAVVTPAQGGTGVANNASSTLTISGSFATTLTVSGITSVTLPTSGTLVNSAVATLSSLTSIGTIGTGVWQGTAVGGTYGGTGVNNGASTITLGGSLTTSGAFTTAITVTNTTAVTLPTSGTLTTLATVIGTANTWTAVQTFTNSDIKLLGSSTGATTFTSANSSASNYTLTFPAITDTVTTNTSASVAFTGGTIDGVTIGGTTPVAIQGYRPVNTQTGTTYTLVIGDTGKMVTMNNASASTLTIPPHSSVAFVAQAEVDVFQLGAGQVTMTAGAGVTIISYSTKIKIAGQYAGVTIKQTATQDTWMLIGNLA